MRINLVSHQCELNMFNTRSLFYGGTAASGSVLIANTIIRAWNAAEVRAVLRRVYKNLNMYVFLCIHVVLRRLEPNWLTSSSLSAQARRT